ncbi:hydroxyindole O-methyltransferase [Lojkania enalia]|uniref:Hydroxyindole O-methyltransferase n=1 Tax=Lojkania enalia TaxID=147567 RepID=A0A9P4N558_9PLEO|nr:hydroxyindole O-methyltransferase [Didymosphaeria enalia]
MALPIGFETAVNPSNIDAVPKLLSEVASAGNALSKTGGAPLVSRLELLAKARELVHALETPREVMIQHPSNTMAISFGVYTGLWSAMAKNGDGPQKVSDLAKQLGMQEELLQRMMRHVAASGYLDMTAPDEFTPNNFSKSLSMPVMSSGYYTGPPILNPTFLHAHDWLKDRGYKIPRDKNDTAYQVAHNTKLHWFEHIQSTPPHGQNFNDHMAGYLLGRPSWSDEGFYPVKKRLLEGFDLGNNDSVLLVDIGGGIGHYTEQFRSKFPDAPGRLILQDLPVVLGQIQGLHPRIERMEYDFFTGQPVKGARVYYTHFILHDWPDEDCVKIAGRVREAMQPSYSKFLVHEHVIPPVKQDSEQTALDLIMMTGFGGKERSAAQWSDLLEKRCGLKIVNIYTVVNGIESVIECERPE